MAMFHMFNVKQNNIFLMAEKWDVFGVRKAVFW